MKRRIPQPAVIALIVLAFVLAGAGSWFLVIAPQRSNAAALDKQIADTREAIDSARALTVQAKRGAKIRIADLYRLTKAMPDQTDMAGIVLELNQVAQESGITFELISPATTAVPISGYAAIPITVEFQGNFYELSDFLYRLRNLVDVRHGALDATGRLFAIDQIDFAEATPPGFPEIRAHLVIDAFVFGTGTAPTTAPAPTTTTSTTTTTTTTTPATTTSAPPPSTGATAAAAGP